MEPQVCPAFQSSSLPQFRVARAHRHGSDLQETVRTFLRDAYARWSVQWVLLGGDTSVLPARYLVSSFGETSPEPIPCDLYFAGLDGTWNADGDALWGEAPLRSSQADPDGGDLYADVYVGRAPVETPAQAAAFASLRRAVRYSSRSGAEATAARPEARSRTVATTR